MTQRLLLALVRVPGLLVTGFLATAGSFAIGMGVMTDCTNTHSCRSTNCGPCLAPNLLLISQRPRRSNPSHGQSVASQRATASASGTSRPDLSARTQECTVTSQSSEAEGYR